MKSFTCLWCGRAFERPDGPGRPPLYCSASHRQRAHLLGKQQEAVANALTKQMRHFQAVAASVGGAEKLAAGVAEAARAQEAFAAEVAEPIRHLQGIFTVGVAEAARAQEVLAAQVTAVAKIHQTFATEIDELAEAQAAFTSTIADSASLGRLQPSLGALQPEALGSLAMSDSLVRIAGIAATRIEAAGYRDHFASALERLAGELPSSDVEADRSSSEPTSEGLLADHSELVRLVGPNLDPVTTRVLLAVLVVASLPFIADAVLAISLAVLGQCWEALKFVEEITSLSPAISGLLSVLTIWGVVSHGR